MTFIYAINEPSYLFSPSPAVDVLPTHVVYVAVSSITVTVDPGCPSRVRQELTICVWLRYQKDYKSLGSGQIRFFINIASILGAEECCRVDSPWRQERSGSVAGGLHYLRYSFIAESHCLT